MRISAVQILHEYLIQPKAEHLENSTDSAFLAEIIKAVGKGAATPGQSLINEKLSLVSWT